MYVYDRPTEGYTTHIPVGVAAFRKTTAEHWNIARTEVVRDLSRCRQRSSEHCVCRGIDEFVTGALGDEIFDWCLAHADPLGLQSVIFEHREWGFGLWSERFRAKADHMDHLHVGLNRWAAANLTEGMVRSHLGGDDMTEEEHELLVAVADAIGVRVSGSLRIYDAVTKKREDGKAISQLDAIESKLDKLLAKP